MQNTVTNGGPMAHASQLAEKAARAVGDGETAAADLSLASLALSIASLAGSAAALAEQTAPTAPVAAGKLSPGPVPLASADTLPDKAINDVFIKTYGFSALTATDRDKVRRIYDLTAAKLRAQFPNETPTQPPAPFVRGVDELSDDEIDEDARGAWPWSPLSGFDGQYLAFLRDFATAVAARLRVDGPPAEPKPDQSAPTFDILISAALHYAAEWAADKANGMYRPSALAPARSDVDQAAREHVTALLGPATGGVIAAPRGLPELSAADVEYALDLFVRTRLDQRNAGANETGARRDGVRAALAWYRSLADTRPTVAAVRSGYPWLRLSPGGYEPAKLAPGSVIVAGGTVYQRLTSPKVGDDLVWVSSHPRGVIGGWWQRSETIPTDGVLVVDGATLGGQS